MLAVAARLGHQLAGHRAVVRRHAGHAGLDVLDGGVHHLVDQHRGADQLVLDELAQRGGSLGRDHEQSIIEPAATNP
ncbi:MAG: hypothetical protein U1F50_21770 [Rubrivivax sp.]